MSERLGYGASAQILRRMAGCQQCGLVCFAIGQLQCEAAAQCAEDCIAPLCMLPAASLLCGNLAASVLAAAAEQSNHVFVDELDSLFQ